MTEPRFYVWQTPPPGHPLLAWRLFRPLHILNAWRAEWSYPRGYSGPRVEGAAPHPSLLARAWVHRQQHYGVGVGTHGERWGGLYIFGLGVAKSGSAIWSPSGPLADDAGALMRHPGDALSTASEDDLPVLPGSPPGSRVEWRAETIFTAAGRAAVRPWAEAFAAALLDECASARVPLPDAIVWDWEDHVLPWWAVRRNTAEHGGVQTGNIHAQRLDPRADSEIVARGLTLSGLFEAEPIGYDGSQWHLDAAGWRTWDSWLHEAASEALYEAAIGPIARACGIEETSNWNHAAVRPGAYIDEGTPYPFQTRAPTYCRESLRTLNCYPVRRLRESGDPDSPLTPWALHHAGNIDAMDDPSRALLWITAHDWSGYDGDWTRPAWFVPSEDDQRALASAAASRGVRRVALWFEDRRGWSAEPWDRAAELIDVWASAWGLSEPPPPPPDPSPGRRSLSPGDVVRTLLSPGQPPRWLCWKLTDETRAYDKIPPDERVPGRIITSRDFGSCSGNDPSSMAPSCAAAICCPRDSYVLGRRCGCSPVEPVCIPVWRRDALLAELARIGRTCAVLTEPLGPAGETICYVWSSANETVSLPDPLPPEYCDRSRGLSDLAGGSCCGCCIGCEREAVPVMLLRQRCDSLRRAHQECQFRPDFSFSCSVPDSMECCPHESDRLCWERIYRVENRDGSGSVNFTERQEYRMICQPCAGPRLMQEVYRYRARNGIVEVNEVTQEPFQFFPCPRHDVHGYMDFGVTCSGPQHRTWREYSLQFESCAGYQFRDWFYMLNTVDGSTTRYEVLIRGVWMRGGHACAGGCPESSPLASIPARTPAEVLIHV